MTRTPGTSFAKTRSQQLIQLRAMAPDIRAVYLDPELLSALTRGLDLSPRDDWQLLGALLTASATSLSRGDRENRLAQLVAAAHRLGGRPLSRQDDVAIGGIYRDAILSLVENTIIAEAISTDDAAAPPADADLARVSRQLVAWVVARLDDPLSPPPPLPPPRAQSDRPGRRIATALAGAMLPWRRR